MVDLGACFSAAAGDPLTLPERGVELVGVRDPVLAL